MAIIDRCVFETFRKVAKRSGITPFQAICLLVYAQMAALSGRTDIVLGVPIGHRGQASRDVIGCLAQAVPFRIALNPRATLSTAAPRVGADLLRDASRARFPVWRHARQVFDRVQCRPYPDVVVGLIRSEAFAFGEYTARYHDISGGARLPSRLP